MDNENLFDEFGNYIGPDPTTSLQRQPSAQGSDGDEHDADVMEEDFFPHQEGINFLNFTHNLLILPFFPIESRSIMADIVLYEDKKHFLSTHEVYGSRVETLVQEEDTQPLSEPIIAPERTIRFEHLINSPDDNMEGLLSTFPPIYDPSYLHGLMMSSPGGTERIRNVAILGHLHHGKSSLLDLLISFAHPELPRMEDGSPPQYMDRFFLERDRMITLVSKPITLLLPTAPLTATGGGSHNMILNLMDTPGHPDFKDEAYTALRFSDGIILVVDVVEGMLLGTEMALRKSLSARLPIILVLNKMERLWMECKLPPIDAYHKIKHVIEEINTFVNRELGTNGRDDNRNGFANVNNGSGKAQSTIMFSPEKGNVLFASTQSGWIFSLESFCQAVYLCRPIKGSSSSLLGRETAKEMSLRLWGDVYYDEKEGVFTKNSRLRSNNHGNSAPPLKRSFITLILEPLYKIYTQIVGEDKPILKGTIEQLGIRLKEKEYGLNTKMVLYLVMTRFLSSFKGSNSLLGNAGNQSTKKDGRTTIYSCAPSLVSAIEKFIPSPIEASFNHLVRFYHPSITNKNNRDNDNDNNLAISNTLRPYYKMTDLMKTDATNGILLAWMGKTYPHGDGGKMECLVRIFSGTLKMGQTIRIINGEREGEDFHIPNSMSNFSQFQPSGIITLDRRLGVELFLPGGRYRLRVDSVPAGSWALLSYPTAILKTNLSEGNKWKALAALYKSATIVDASLSEPSHTPSFLPLITTKDISSVIKVAIEPVHPKDLPRMKDAIDLMLRTMPALGLRIEDNGEISLLGVGELMLDCTLHDLRKIYSNIVTTDTIMNGTIPNNVNVNDSTVTTFQDLELKVSDPVVLFRETVGESSYVASFATSSNGKCRLTLLAEPLDPPELVEALSSGSLPFPSNWKELSKGKTDDDEEELARILQYQYNWDILAARSVLAFGPDPLIGSNILLDDILDSSKKELLKKMLDPIIVGFRLACNAGPLCEEPMRGILFKLIDVHLEGPSGSGSSSGGSILAQTGQITAAMRKACHAAFLTAQPRMMEPIAMVEILATNQDCLEPVYTLLGKRRGHVLQEIPRPGTPFYQLRALIPFLDSFGFETDVRIHTQGMASVLLHHEPSHHWQVIPGDPLDRTLKPIPLEPSPAPVLARDCMLKVRRRRGLGEDINLKVYLEEAMLEELVREETISGIKGLDI